jgi:hypothetical protein
MVCTGGGINAYQGKTSSSKKRYTFAIEDPLALEKTYSVSFLEDGRRIVRADLANETRTCALYAAGALYRWVRTGPRGSTPRRLESHPRAASTLAMSSDGNWGGLAASVDATPTGEGYSA